MQSTEELALLLDQPGVFFVALTDRQALLFQGGSQGFGAVAALPGGRDGRLRGRQIEALPLGCLVLIGRERGVRQITLGDASRFELFHDLKTAFAPQSLDHSLVVAARRHRMTEPNLGHPRDLLLPRIRM